MKALVVVLISILSSFVSRAQNNENTLAVLDTGNGKVSLAKNSIFVSDWHEKSFWSLYEGYADKIQQPTTLFHSSLAGLLASNEADRQAEHAQRLISSENDALAVTQQYFEEICTNFNGTIAFEFLQTEVLFDIMENLSIFESHPERHFSFYPWSLESKRNKISKHDAIVETLALSPLEQENFFNLYDRYEQECDDLLGEDYNLFALFNEDPSEYTPGMAKGLARNLLLLWQRELVLREKYFALMNHDYGSSLASRFIVWENYYSAISKMYIWSGENDDQREYLTRQK